MVETRVKQMDFFDVIQKRKSIRKFKSKTDVPDDDLNKILAAATRAPCMPDDQYWHFVVVKKKATIKKMVEAVNGRIEEISRWIDSEQARKRFRGFRFGFTFFGKAPVTIAVLQKHYVSLSEEILFKYGIIYGEIERMRADPSLQSVAAATENLLLAATALGYGGCWMTGPLIAAREIEKILLIREPWRLVSLIPLGKPDEFSSPRPRKALEEVCTFIRR